VTDHSLTDLCERARTGDTLAETQLLERLTARFRYFARQRIWNAADADELVQEALVVICREYKGLTITQSFAAWAWKVLDNRILAYIRSQAARNRRIDRDAPDADAFAAPASDPEVRRRLIDCLGRIGKVNQRYARVLNLHTQGYGTEEICARMELKPNTLYSLLHRGRAMLRSCLETGALE
jgi:RNA polymerase sigma factor (sigma-70 family)